MDGVGGVLLEAESRTTGGEYSADKSRGEGGEKGNTTQHGSQWWETALSQGEAALGDPTGAGGASCSFPRAQKGDRLSYHCPRPPRTNMRFLAVPPIQKRDLQWKPSL